MTIGHNNSLRLGKDFSLLEVLVSDSHPEMLRGVILPEPMILKAYYGVRFGLQKVRDKFGPVNITSGYRTQALNAAVGGVSTSQHTYGEAWDFICPDANMLDVYHYLCDDLDWPGQCFFYQEAGHIHLALPRPKVNPTRAIFKRKRSI